MFIDGSEAPIPELSSMNVGRGWDLTPHSIFYLPQKLNGPSPLYRFDLRTRKTVQIKGISKLILPLLAVLSISEREDRLAISYLNFSIGDLMLVEDWR